MQFDGSQTSTTGEFHPQGLGAENSPKLKLDGLHLLVVDDDADVRELLTTLIHEEGAIVRTAESVAAALRALDDEAFDVVLSDLAMPGHDGYDLIEAIRHDRRPDVRDVRAIAVTAHDDDAHRSRAMAAGFDDYLTKPVDANRLVSVIATVVHGRSARRHAPTSDDGARGL